MFQRNTYMDSKVKLFFTSEGLGLTGPTIFLAGPTPRSNDVVSWRPKAVELFKKTLPNCNLIIPEPNWEKGQSFADIDFEYGDIIGWEQEGIELAEIVLFWVPRDLKDMPAFTTNVEFGYCVAECPEKVYYGRPFGSPKNRYLDHCYEKYCDREAVNQLEDLVEIVTKKLNHTRVECGTYGCMAGIEINKQYPEAGDVVTCDECGTIFEFLADEILHLKMVPK